MYRVEPDGAKRIAKHFCSVLHQETGTFERLKLNVEQRTVLEAIYNHRRVIVLKGRQVGISTVCCLHDVMFAITNAGISVAIVADTAEKAQGLLAKCSSFAKHLGVKLTTDNVKSITLENGSTIDALSAVSHAEEGESRVGRSKSYALIHASEMAFWNNAHAVFAALTSTALPNARIVIESTASAAETLFRQIWDGLRNGWHHVFLTIEKHRAYRAPPESITDEEWEHLQAEYGFGQRPCAAWWQQKLTQDFAGDVHRCLREYPVQPQHAFAYAEGRWILTHEVCEVRTEGPWQIYRETENPTVFGVDTAAGVGSDSSAIAVLDRVTGALIATYKRNDIAIPDFVREVKAACDRFRPAAVVVESNGVGAAVFQELSETRWPVFEQISNWHNGEKLVRLNRIKVLIETGRVPIGPDLLHEVRHSVVDRKGRYDGPDDLLNAFSFGLKWLEAMPYRPPKPVADKHRVFIPPHARPKRVMF